MKTNIPKNFQYLCKNNRIMEEEIIEDHNINFGDFIQAFDSDGNVIRDDYTKYEEMKEYYDKLFKEQGIDVNYL